MANTTVHDDPDTSALVGKHVAAVHLISPGNGLAIDPTNQDFVQLIGSAAYTTTQTVGNQFNLLWRGCVIVLDVTSAGTGSITLEIDGYDPVSGKYYPILTGAAVTTVTTNVYRVYPGLTAAANATANDILPHTWRVKVTANNANPVSYSVGAIYSL